MPPQISAVGHPQPLNLLSLLHSLPLGPGSWKNGVCGSCSYTFSATGPMSYKNQHKSKLKPHRYPYREAQAKQRKAANIARQKVLREERVKAMGDPVRSINTPFIQSLTTGEMPGEPTKDELRNFFLHPEELPQSLNYSKKLSAPYLPNTSQGQQSAPSNSLSKSANVRSPPSVSSQNKDPPVLPIERGVGRLSHTEQSTPVDGFGRSKDAPPTPTKLIEVHRSEHENAARALSLITSLSNGSSADTTRLNIQRCVSTLGRHITDAVLPPRPVSVYNTNPAVPKLRAGPDTGSSEVQIGVLTTKINVLANSLHNNDKINKRNLRLLVHKRQKLLAYLRRKDRAGPRWQNLVDTLGIQDAMWKGEISL